MSLIYKLTGWFPRDFTDFHKEVKKRGLEEAEISVKVGSGYISVPEREGFPTVVCSVTYEAENLCVRKFGQEYAIEELMKSGDMNSHPFVLRTLQHAAHASQTLNEDGVCCKALYQGEEIQLENLMQPLQEANARGKKVARALRTMDSGPK